MKIFEYHPTMPDGKRRELVENLLSRVVVDGSDVEFELKYLPGQAGKNQPHSHLFNYSKNHDPAWQDPNGELMEAVQKRGGKVISREA